jgi:hypothetical protein
MRIRNVPLPAVLLAFADGAGWIAIAMPPAGGRSRDAGASRFRGPNHIVRLGSGASHYPFLHPAGARGHDKRLTAGCVCRWNVRLTKGQHARKVGAGEANLAEAHQFAEWMFVEGPLLARKADIRRTAGVCLYRKWPFARQVRSHSKKWATANPARQSWCSQPDVKAKRCYRSLSPSEAKP